MQCYFPDLVHRICKKSMSWFYYGCTTVEDRFGFQVLFIDIYSGCMKRKSKGKVCKTAVSKCVIQSKLYVSYFSFLHTKGVLFVRPTPGESLSSCTLMPNDQILECFEFSICICQCVMFNQKCKKYANQYQTYICFSFIVVQS